MKKTVIVSVVNDLATDRRVDRTCLTIVEMGFDVLLVGRKLKHSQPLVKRPYKTHRMQLLFAKGPLFYAEFNLRILFFLLFRKSNLLVANDLDTLLPNYLCHRCFGVPLVYDTHEYFTGVPELTNRPFVRKIWKYIENWIFPKLKHVVTVNESIAKLYEQEYDIKLTVVRNIPLRVEGAQCLTKKDIGVSENKKIILLQGAGINIDRGAEEAIEAMKWIEDAVLVILGGGDVFSQLKKDVRQKDLMDKVVFIHRQPPEILPAYTALADIGLSIDKDTNINYRNSLPNKLFDYIYAGVPILASRRPEIQKIIEHYTIGTFIENHEPAHIAEKIRHMLANQPQIIEWKKNLKIAAEELNWEKEKTGLIKIFEKYA